MQFDFPPPSRLEMQHEFMHIVFLATIAVSLATVFCTLARKVNPWFFLANVIPLLVGAIFGAWNISDSRHLPIIFGYWPVLGMLSGIGCVRTYLGLKRLTRPAVRRFAVGSYVIVGAVMCSLWFCNQRPSERVKARSPRNPCKNSMKQIGLALKNYAEIYGRLPAASTGQPEVSWRVQILRQIDQAPIWKKYDFSATWDSQENLPVAQTDSPHWQCFQHAVEFDDQDALGRFYTTYFMITGKGTISDGPDGTRFDELTDGTSNTITVIEAAGRRVVWTEPRDINIDTEPIGLNLPGPQKHFSPGVGSSYHGRGAHVLLGDGTVRFVSNDVDPEVLKNLMTISDGALVGKF